MEVQRQLVDLLMVAVVVVVRVLLVATEHRVRVVLVVQVYQQH
jgi:hypothetical protein